MILSVDVNEDAETVKAFVEEQGLSFAIFLDDGTSAAKYQVSGIPASFVISAEGVIYDTHVGAVDIAYLEELVQEMPGAGTPQPAMAQATESSASSPDVGSRAPDIALKGLDGKEAHVSDFLGKRVLLNFWTTW